MCLQCEFVAPFSSPSRRSISNFYYDILTQLRQLLGAHASGHNTGLAGTVGHGGPGGLRPPETALLPADRRFPDMLQRGESLVL